jgi:hypothetical protein
MSGKVRSVAVDRAGTFFSRNSERTQWGDDLPSPNNLPGSGRVAAGGGLLPTAWRQAPCFELEGEKQMRAREVAHGLGAKRTHRCIQAQ